MLAFYADENVPRPLVSALRSRGVDVGTVTEHSGQGTPDERVLADAHQLQRVLLTSDVDFLRLAQAAQQQDEVFAPVIFWPQQQRTISSLVARIVAIASNSNYASLESQVTFL